MTRRPLTNLILSLTLLAGGSLAMADDMASPSDALKGPAVPERNTPGGSGSFGSDKGDLAKRSEVPLPFPMFMRMLNETLGESSPEALRLSDAQREQIQGINAKHMDAMKAFMDSHKDEIQAIVKDHPEAGRMLREFGLPGGPGREGPGARGQDGLGNGGPGKGGKRPGAEGGPEGGPRGGRPPEGDPMQEGARPERNEKNREAVMAKLKELRDQAPKADDARTAVWAVLTEPQQKAVQVKVDDFKAKELAKRDERYKAQQKKRFEEGRGADKKPGQSGEAPAKLDAAMRAEVLASLPKEAQDKLVKLPQEQQDRALARLAQLPPERRAEAIQRMSERRRGGGAPEQK